VLNAKRNRTIKLPTCTTDMSVVIQGESGTEKDLSPKSIHPKSKTIRFSICRNRLWLPLPKRIGGKVELFGTYQRKSFTGAIKQ